MGGGGVEVCHILQIVCTYSHASEFLKFSPPVKLEVMLNRLMNSAVSFSCFR